MAIPLSGKIRVEITCADTAGVLFACTKEGISVYDVVFKDDLTIALTVGRADFVRLCQLAEAVNGKINVKSKEGLLWFLRRWAGRKVLLLGIIGLLVLSLWLPTRILFITVEGNALIPAKQIIEQAQWCGISFGTSRSLVRSEKMKNRLLEAIPALQWTGINTKGCTAVITVKERTEEDVRVQKSAVSNIVAVCDGVIESCTSYKGNLLCKVGQAVQKGDVLISGYLDVGLCVCATQAQGEIYAQTVHEVRVRMPSEFLKKEAPLETKRTYSLLLGKKRINFSKDSGISGTSCDRIYSEYFITLPGGFRLPLGISVSCETNYACFSYSSVTDYERSVVRQLGRRYISSQMISGEILQENVNFQQADDLCVVRTQYICVEMIGRVQHEEIMYYYGKNN